MGQPTQQKRRRRVTNTSMTKAAAAVEFRNVTKRYGTVTAVDAITFTIEPGKLVTLLGPSGCGKTTTLRLIAGLEMASEGMITIGGKDVTRLSAADRDVSMVFQSYALFPHMNVIDNAAYGPSVSGVPKARAREMGAEKLALVGLKGFETRLPSELSGGQQQRVAVARALVLEPQVLLFDEPLSNLDAKLRRRVREDIRDLQQRLNLTVAYVTHDQQEALAVSDSIIVMSNARIAQMGRPRDLYEAPANAFVSDFIGDSNQVEGEITARNGARATVMLGGALIDLRDRGNPVGATKIAIRPEAVVLSVSQPSAPSLACRVLKAAYLGSHMEYTVESPLGPLFVIDANVATPHAIGAAVQATFAPLGVTIIPN
jgi:iron(III) transport system ATP-binding protein